MGNLSEMAGKINVAAAAIRNLPSGRTGGDKEERLRIIRSLYSQIQDARLRGVSFNTLAETISDATGMKVSGVSLSKYILILKEEQEAAVRNISRTLKGESGK